jgi:hypothetical protein
MGMCGWPLMIRGLSFRAAAIVGIGSDNSAEMDAVLHRTE